MLLQKLSEYASRMENTPFMYIHTPIKWLVDIDVDGRFIAIVRTVGDDKRKNDRGKVFLAPHANITSGVKAKLLAHNGEYVLGIARDMKKKERVAKCHAAFVECVRRCADATGEDDVKAVVKFLESFELSGISLPQDFDPADNVTFRVKGRLPIELPSVMRFWAEENSSHGTEMECLVCGKIGPVVELHDVKIKGIPGGQPSGMTIVSANAEAFESYGLRSSLIAPTCAKCAERYAKAANALLRGKDTSIRVGLLAYIFWTRKQGGFSVFSFLDRPSPDNVKALVMSVWKGRGVPGIDDDDFYAAAFGASGGRVAVRDWIETTVGVVKRNLARWFALQRIVDSSGAEGEPLGLWPLASATIPSNTVNAASEINPNVPRVLLHAALKGAPLPKWLLYQAVKRNRAERTITRPRAALIKTILLSWKKNFKEGEMERLDERNTSPAYLCGRLLAVLESVQKRAIRKATIVDRFFGTASSAPASVFGRLIRGSQSHLGKIRNENEGAYNALEQRIEKIVAGLDGFPHVLTLEEQGLFSLGYYHQRAHDRASAKAYREKNKTEKEEEESND